jgi:hypothetical protein
MRHSHAHRIDHRPPPPEPVKIPAGLEFAMIILLLMALGGALLSGWCLSQPLGEKGILPFSTGPSR